MTDSVRSVKSNKSIRSLRGNRSQKNLKSVKSFSTFGDPSTPNFEVALQSTCRRYSCPYKMYVKKDKQEDEFYQNLRFTEKPIKYKKITVAVPGPVSIQDVVKLDAKTTTTVASEESIDDDDIIITSYYDNSQNLVELKLINVRGILPRSLIQIFGYLSSSFDYLTKLTINRCRINAEIVYELSKLLYMGYITDICLDGSPVREGNYFILLDHKDSRIKHLSLSRCNINDVVCKEIAMRLHFLCPAEKTLLLLNLSSNHITDEGVKYLSTALRSNRRLRYLNLADNRIGDDGAYALFGTLMEFRLTDDENTTRKTRLVVYLREKSKTIVRYLNECESKSYEDLSIPGLKSGKKRKSSALSLKSKANFKKDFKKEKPTFSDYYYNKAELYATELIGPFKDPYDSISIAIKKKLCYCLGNMTLCYLNLSYNNLGYLSVKKLLSTLQYQRIAKKPTQFGLVKVVIEGNPMPTDCMEYKNIHELFRMAKCFQQNMASPGQRRRSTRISMLPGLSPGNQRSN